eukprot:150082-Amphidinium_carterae.1
MAGFLFVLLRLLLHSIATKQKDFDLLAVFGQAREPPLQDLESSHRARATSSTLQHHCSVCLSLVDSSRSLCLDGLPFGNCLQLHILLVAAIVISLLS